MHMNIFTVDDQVSLRYIEKYFRSSICFCYPK